jgi:hypothetical protein
MASSKQKTTMNKLNRERKLRERRLDKEARKVARMNAPAEAEVQLDEHGQPIIAEPVAESVVESAVEPAVESVAEPGSGPGEASPVS